MPNPANKSLVEVLEERGKVSQELAQSDRGGYFGTMFSASAETWRQAARVAEPYEARRLALEKVAQAAHLFAMTGESMDGDELKRYLSAVPPLPEEQDGS